MQRSEIALPFSIIGFQMERLTEMFGAGIGKTVTFAFLSIFEKVIRSTIL
jgi:hypothetical protein